jgi:orotidine-5'-phosphate decarboxylase
VFQPGRISDRERLIVALDVPTVDEARRAVGMLGDAVCFYKVGMQLQFAEGGLSYVDELVNAGKKVFLDSKLFDIEETVARAVENIARKGVTFLTVHGNGKVIRAAAKARAASPLRLLSVTVLTNLDAADIAEMGFENIDVRSLALHRARKAIEAGADGVITSGQEAAAIREIAEGRVTIVTPGIRPDGSAADDQKRTATPREAILHGADYLVVGRPILRDPDPRAAAERFQSEIAAARKGL